MADTKAPAFKGIHFGWIVFITMCLCNFTIYNVAYNSLFALPIANALGVTRGVVMVFATFYSMAGMAVSVLFGLLLSSKKVPINLLMGVSCAISFLVYFLFGWGNQLWMIYAAGLLMAIPVQGCAVMANQVFASNWYADSHRGKLLSIQNSCRGLGSTALPIIIQLAIDAAGYQMGYVVLMIAVLPTTILCFMLRRSPADMGLKPLGYKAGDEEKDAEKAALKAAEAGKLKGWNLRHCMRTPAFWLIVVAVFCLGMENGFTSNFSGIAEEFMNGAENFAMIGALMVSIQSACNTIGNFVVGFVVDIIGAPLTTVIWFSIFACFFIITLLFGHNNEIALYVAAGCFGLNSGILRNPFPMTVRQLFGPRYFGSLWGFCNAVKPLVSGLAATCIALSYDFLGSYNGSLIYGLVMCLIALGAFLIASRFVGKYDWENHPDEDDGKVPAKA